MKMYSAKSMYAISLAILSTAGVASGSGKSIGEHLVDLLRSPAIVVDQASLWSITVLESNDGPDIFVRVASKPASHADTVCETELVTYRFYDHEGVWIEKSRQQAMRENVLDMQCDRAIPVDRFHRISGDRLEPRKYLAVFRQLERERERISAIMNGPIDWNYHLAEICVDGDVIDVRLLRDGCLLDVLFAESSDGSILMREYSAVDLECIRK